MTYQRRTTKLPSMSNHENDFIYWTTIDTMPQRRTREPRRPASRRAESVVSRNYIDPWDLENYAYIQSLESPEPSPAPSPAGEPVSSTFYYMPGNVDDCPCYAGLDEQMFYNEKYDMMHNDDMAYSTYTDVESSSTERNSSCSGGSTVSTLQLHTPGFGVQSHHSIVLPKPEPQIEFPAPPPPPSSAYEYYTNVSVPSSSHYDSRCYECVDEHIPLYATNNTIMPRRRRRLRRSTSSNNSIYGYVMEVDEPQYFERFGLSKKGLLQIDYSCNWNNLQRLITSNKLNEALEV